MGTQVLVKNRKSLAINNIGGEGQPLLTSSINSNSIWKFSSDLPNLKGFGGRKSIKELGSFTGS